MTLDELIRDIETTYEVLSDADRVHDNDAAHRARARASARDRVRAAIQRYTGSKYQALRDLYNVTTWLHSVMPTARIDEGASQPYHDAALALALLRDDLRNRDVVQHDESYWNRHLKSAL